MIHTVYAKKPLYDSSKALVGYITWDSSTGMIGRFSPDCRCLDRFHGWDDPAEFYGWLKAHSNTWSLDPDEAYFSDQRMDIGL